MTSVCRHVLRIRWVLYKMPFYQSPEDPCCSYWELLLLISDSQLASISSPVSFMRIKFYCFQHLDMSDPPPSILGILWRSPAAHHSCVPLARDRCPAQSQPSKHAVRVLEPGVINMGRMYKITFLIEMGSLSTCLSLSLSLSLPLSVSFCLSICLSLSVYPWLFLAEYKKRTE